MKSIDSLLTSVFTPEDGLNMAGKDIEFCGCIHRIRDMSGFAFIIIRNGRYLFQCVYSNDNCSFPLETLNEGDHIKAFGLVNREERAANGFEIILKNITVLSTPAEAAPVCLSKKYMNLSLDVNLSLRPFTLRNPIQRAIFKIQEGVVSGFRNYMLEKGFTEIHSPKIVAAGAEGGANIFKLDYFGTKAFLAQSPQFYKQTMVGVFERVFEIGAVYRAEKHSTSRHLNEYIGLDFEMGYIDSMYDIMAMETGMLKAVIETLKKDYAEEINMLKADLPTITTIPAVTFAEAKEILKSINKATKNPYDLDPDEEQAICDYAKEKLGSEFIFITHYPSSKRPFYAMDDKENPKLALSFDLLFRGLEITTGGQRIHDYNEQVEKMIKYKLNPENFESYLMIHKYGMPPHGGLGIGLERLVMKLLNLSNVRQASLFPRDLTRLDP